MRPRSEVPLFQSFLGAALACLCTFAGIIPARAETAETSPSAPVEMDFSLAAVTDYRYRGLSLSDKKPSLQVSLTASHNTGLYAALWAATIADNGGADLENQITLGYSAEGRTVAFDLAAAYYLYPGAPADNYGELTARISRAIGPAEVGAIMSYAPAQANIGSVDNLYLGLDASLAVGASPLTLSGNIGVEDGAFGDQKLDWSLGFTGDAAGLTFGVAYVDSSRTSRDPQGTPTVVGSISKTF